MTNRTWIGGANNQASNPKDWSPKGAPHSGDALTMTSGTMNVIHDDLAGDVLAINSGTVNLTRGSNATIAANGDALINIQGTDQLLLNVVPTGWVNTFPTVPPPPVGGSATVNLAANSMWVGGIFSVGALTINGGSNSVFQNNGLTFLGESFVFAGHTTINANVGGTGQTEVEGGDYSPTLEFGKSVGSNQKITLSNPETIPDTKSLLVLDNPVGFHGLVVSNFLPAPGIPTEIDLRGLATADGYSYQNDMLSIYAGNSVIDTMRLNLEQTYEHLAVQKTANSVNVICYSDTTNPPVGLPFHI